MDEKITKVPVQFIIFRPPLADSRFTPVKILIMHTGLNLNNSYFHKEDIERAIPSLANIPILGFVEPKGFDGSDFKGHEEMLIIKDDKLKVKYIGSAYGVIPESNNARFEIIDGKEYLVADGLIFNMFEEAKEIIDRDGSKGQSMELWDENITGEWIDGVYHFKDFTFRGACMLGDDVVPAMKGAKVIKEQIHNYSFSYSDDILNALRDFNKNSTLLDMEENNQGERGTGMDFEKMYNETQAELEAKIAELEARNTELEAKIAEVEALTIEKEEFSAQLEEANSSLVELNTFKAEILAEQRQAEEVELFAKFEGKVDEAIVVEIKETASEFTIEELESKLLIAFGKAQLEVQKEDEKEEEVEKEFEIKFTKKEENTLESLVKDILGE